MSWDSQVRNYPGVSPDPQAARNAIPETMVSGKTSFVGSSCFPGGAVLHWLSQVPHE